MTKSTDTRRTAAGYFTRPVARFLSRTPVTPNTLTWLGFWISAGAAVLVVTDNLFAAGFVVIAAGLFDMLDGALARSTNRVTVFGGILDSTLDRLSEAVLLLGILVVFAREQKVAECLLVGAAMLGSIMVSYLRARSEAVGIDCKVGIFTRPERVVVLALGLLLSRFEYALVIALVIITVFSFFTTGQRLFHAWRQTKN